jgi:hypothetical protein
VVFVQAVNECGAAFDSASLVVEPVIRYVATTGADVGVCDNPANPCATVQYAVDQADESDEIHVATGAYTGVNNRGGLAQVAYIDKTVSVRGGYSADFSVHNPANYPTTLDAQRQGRVLVVSGDPWQDVSPTIEGLRITGGDATGLGGDPAGDAGGGVYVVTATVAISGSQIYSNVASTAGQARGGGLYLRNGRATIRHSEIYSNTSSTAGAIGKSAYGGGLYLVDADGSLLEDNLVHHNVARQTTSSSSSDAGRGGGLYLKDSDALVLANTFSDNTAGTSTASSSGYGGGLYVSGGAPTLQGNTVVANVANPNGGGSGGGLYLSYSPAQVLSNTIQANVAASSSKSGSGGGLYLAKSNAYLQGNEVVSNTASAGAGAGYGGGLDQDNSAFHLVGNTFRANTAAAGGGIGFGGGLRIWHSAPVTLTGNLIQDNVAGVGGQGSGGGLYISLNSVVLAEGNTILGNTATISPTATGRGGGLNASSSSLTLTNNIVADNHANTQGSGLWSEGSIAWGPVTGHLRHNTIANNHSSGQGVYAGAYTTLAFTNTILVGHTVGITVAAGSTATLEATLWHDNGADTSGPGTVITGTVNIYGDPAFLDPLNGDYHIGPTSAAIDQGVPAGVTTDIDGQPRDASPDLGADELYPPAAPALMISRSGNDALLTWTHDSAFSSYQVWRSTQIYFTPGDNCAAPPAGQACVVVPAPGSSHTHTGAVADVVNNYAYLLLGVSATGQRSSPSNRVAEFDFGLTPGTP